MGQGEKMISFVISRTKIKVTRRRSSIWRLGGGIILYSFGRLGFLVEIGLYRVHNFDLFQPPVNKHTNDHASGQSGLA